MLDSIENIMTNELKSMSARIGHIKRRLLRDEVLTGKHLELALDILGNGDSGQNQIDQIARKLEAGETLDAYVLHIMVDVILLHARLGGASSLC
jgi:hypothetical protein